MTMKRKTETRDNKKKKTVDIRAIKKSVSSVMRDRGDLFVVADDTFGTALIYAYGEFREYNELREKLFGDREPLSEAFGYCSHGTIRSIPCTCNLVWVNSKAKKEEAIPWFIHEMSHLVDFLVEEAHIADRNGEARAYLLERETKRVLERMFGMKSASAVTEKQIMEVLK